MLQLGIKTVLANSKTWRSFMKSEVGLEELAQLGLKLPEKATKAIKIRGEYHNGSFADFIFLRDQRGDRLGSISLFPNGKRIEIEFSHEGLRNASTSKSTEIKNQFFDPRMKLYTHKTFEGNTLIREQNTFSEVYKLDDYMKNQPEKYWQKTLGMEKPEDKLYHLVIRTGKEPKTNGTTDFSQEVMQIETGSNPSRLRLKSTSSMAADGEVSLQNIEQSGVNMDTSNPYFQTMLMDVRDMLKGAYIEIVKRRGLKGIEPPLKLEEFTGIYRQASGTSPRDCSSVGINMSQKLLKQRTKALQASTLGHECEHSFTQNVNIHLAHLANMKTNDVASKKFFNGVIRRFKPIKKGTQEYKDAEIYLDEFRQYNKVIWDKDGKIISKAHHALQSEKDADLGGVIEYNYFWACVNDFIKNFPLFNSSYALRI